MPIIPRKVAFFMNSSIKCFQYSTSTAGRIPYSAVAANGNFYMRQVQYSSAQLCQLRQHLVSFSAKRRILIKSRCWWQRCMRGGNRRRPNWQIAKGMASTKSAMLRILGCTGRGHVDLGMMRWDTENWKQSVSVGNARKVVGHFKYVHWGRGRLIRVHGNKNER